MHQTDTEIPAFAKVAVQSKGRQEMLRLSCQPGGTFLTKTYMIAQSRIDKMKAENP